MDDIRYIFFYQELVLLKADFQIIEQSGCDIKLKYSDGQECEPYVYFRPLNVEPDADKLHRYSEYHFSELLFECYEGHTPIVSREVTDPVYHYQVESALGKPLQSSIPTRPLDIPVNGTLRADVVDVPFDEVMAFL